MHSLAPKQKQLLEAIAKERKVEGITSSLKKMTDIEYMIISLRTILRECINFAL